MKIKIKKLDQNVSLPSYAKLGDAGLDLRSNEDKVLLPGERYCFKTGLAFEIPEGFVGLVWDRSGMALKEGLKTMAGVVDSGYRGEIGIVALNTSDTEIKVEKGDRIAQILIQPVMRAEIEEIEELSESERGEGGFGGSGKK